MFLFSIHLGAPAASCRDLRVATTKVPARRRCFCLPNMVSYWSTMRFSLFLALVLAIAVAGTQWYQSTKHICAIPVTYRLGSIDDSFDISRSDALTAITTATSAWEEKVGQSLFLYDEVAADITVSFVFDDRQAQADAREIAQERLNGVSAQNESIRAAVAELSETYEAMRLSFIERSDVYESALQAYNDRVRQVNDRGGADGSLFAELEATQIELNTEAEALRTLQAELNQVGSQLNQLSVEGNRLITEYNEKVDVFNDQYAHGGIFTQGDYTGDGITIYKFSNEAELITVLAHEFGHALGIDHVETEGSLMYYLLEEELNSPVPVTDIDQKALQATCQFDSNEFKVRQFIRSLLS